MTIYFPVSNTLSVAARQALSDHLNSVPLTRDLLDIDTSDWTEEQSQSVAEELEAAGFGHERNGCFVFEFKLHAPEQLPTDHLDELVPALAAVDRIVTAADRIRTPEDPDPDNGLHVPFGILLQLQNVLRIATYQQQGTLSATDVNSQLPAVATMLARAVRAQVAL